MSLLRVTNVGFDGVVKIYEYCQKNEITAVCVANYRILGCPIITMYMNPGVKGRGAIRKYCLRKLKAGEERMCCTCSEKADKVVIKGEKVIPTLSATEGQEFCRRTGAVWVPW